MTNKPEAIVFFDLDGTLLTRQVEVAQSSIEAIKILKKNNITPMLATGRTVCEVAHIMQQTQIDSIVAMNGQAVVYQKERVFTNNIDSDLIARVYDFSKQRGIPLSFYNDTTMRISSDSQPAQVFYHYLRQTLPPVDDNIYLHEPIQMLLLLCEIGEADYLTVFPELTFIRNTPYCVDVFNKGGSKAYGINRLLLDKGFTDVPTYAFGDGYNDIEMFQVVDHPIAMENGIDELKVLADFVTADNNSDGIAKGLKQAGLI